MPLVLLIGAAWALLRLALLPLTGTRLPDPDDYMRLLEVRDLLSGQAWFDVTQYRMGPPDGASMHWSRLIDLPLAGLILLFETVLPRHLAELWAMALVPLLWLLPALLALRDMAKSLALPRAAALLALVLFPMFPLLPGNFAPLRIDHHTAQSVAALVCAALLVRTGSRGAAVGCGIVGAAWAVISLEALPLLAALAGLYGLRWVLARDRSLAGFLGALAGTATLLSLATRPLTALSGPFCDVVRPGHLAAFAAAALAAGVTPVMMGRRLDALEQRLGTQLVIRTTRRLSLTDQGASYLDECRQLLARWDEAERAVSARHQRASGHLIVSAPAAFGRLHVAPHASSFLKANPEVQLSFNLTDRVVDLVREGYDMGIRIGGQIDPNFVAIKLASNQRVVCGTPAYFRKRGKPRTLEDLRQHNCLAFNLQGGQQRGWYFLKDGKTVTVRVEGNLDCNDGELLHRWVSEGLGLGWRSTWEIQSQLHSGELVTVLDEFALPAYDIMAVYPQQKHLPAKVRFFIEHLKKVYRPAAYWLADKP